MGSVCSLSLQTQGLAFASVHDSYWTHASSIDQMSSVIRETFIALHSSDVLGRLLNEVHLFPFQRPSIAYAFLQFRERYAGYRVPVESLGTSQILKQLGILDIATDIAASRRPKTTAATASGTAAVMTEDEELVEKTLDRPPTVSVVSKEQAVKLLKPVRGQGKRVGGVVATEDKLAPEDSLEGKFVDLVDLLPLVPSKGEFDVNKIKSSLYFFS